MAHTEVILREKVVNLGSEGDVVRVRRGYARNFLVPHGKAFEATKGNLRNLESLKKKRAAREAAELEEAEKIASKIRRVKLELELQTGATGKAFGSISLNDVVKALEEKINEKIDRHLIHMEKPIKSTGQFDIPVKLHPEVTVDIKMIVRTAGGVEVPAEDQEG
ncbi:MAG: 50S ribosomal protein L9 [Verrucomicrobia bacterium]|jgi:large subunit ribosomal protein L9|nr:50S ribosomal protein L9 [Verrucomicrobiota bacterium]